MKQILVVDNHPVMLKFMTNLLVKRGYRVLTAESGLSALEILKTYKPEIIFSDLVMPNISGDKLCRIIRGMPVLKGVFIAILSGVAAEGNLDFAQLGANACIAKGPFNKMAEHVLDVVDQFERQSPSALSAGIRGRGDIHERETTKELLSAKRHFETILKNMSEGIFEVTPDGKIVFTNAKAISMFGIFEQQLLGSDFGDLFGETDRKRVEDLMNGITDCPETIPEESPLIINGRQICLTLIRVPDEKEHSFIAVLKDVTEKRQLEEYLLQTRKMEGIASLAGGIAHEFNNALFAVSGNLELLEMET